MNTKGVWTAIKYKDEVVDPTLSETDPRKRRPTIYLWVRDTDLNRTRLAIKGFKPYFYAIPAIKSQANYILQMKEIEKYELVDFGKRQLYRIYTYIPGQVTKVKRLIQSKFAQAAVREGDVLFELRYLIDQGIRGSVDWYDISNPVPLDEDLDIPLRRIYLDVEIWADRAVAEGHMRKGEYIKCISAYDNYEKIYYTWYVNEFDLKIQGEENWKVIWCANVETMMKAFLTYVKERDPDVITGYNVDFDLLNIRQEAIRNNAAGELNYLSALYDLGYTVGDAKIKKHRIRGVDWARRGLYLDGREVIDILDCIRMISRSQLRSYTLDYVVKKFISKEAGKVTYKGKPVAANLKWIWSEAPEEVLRYNKHDVELIVQLDEQNELINFLDRLRKTVGVKLEDAFSNQRMIDTEALRRRKFPLPSKFSNKKDEKTSYKGALVVSPVPGLHKWVVCLDYKSLYPTIIRTFNIDTDTYVIDKKLAKNKPLYRFTNEDGTKEWLFVKSPRGLFPQMLDDFTALRDSLRKQMAKETDPQKKKLLDVKQEVIKVLSNACFVPGTYILTPFGTRTIEELNIGDTVYSYNKNTGYLEPDKIVAKYKLNYEGDLVVISKKNWLLKVTPEHRILVETRRGKNVIQAKDLKGSETIPFPKGLGRNGLEPSKRLFPLDRFTSEPITRLTKKTIKNYKQEKKLRRTLPIHQFLRLLGWYISEGSITDYPKYHTSRVSISQSRLANPENWSQIKLLLEKLRIRFKYDERGFYIHSRILASVLAKLCGKGSKSKHLPSFIFKSSRVFQESLLETLKLGDGDKHRNRYSTGSERLAKDLFHLLVLMGLHPTLRYEEASKIYRITWRKAHSLRLHEGNIRREQYKGLVYCITCEKNSFILAGLGGTCGVVGQCYGAFGYRSRKHNLEVAEAVTAFGQRMIKLAADVANELGFQVIYGDTDSVFVSTGKSNYGEAYNAGIKLQDEIMKRIPKFTYQFNVEERNLFQITFEKIYDRFFMGKGQSGKAVKKRYCGRIIQLDGKTKLDVKGLDTKRSDTSIFASELQRKLLETLLEGKSKIELAKEIAEELNKIDQLPREIIGVPSAISKPLKKGYKKNPIQKKAALNSNMFLGTQFEYGSKPLRVYIKVPPREKVFPRSGKKTEEEKKDLDRQLKELNVIAFDNTTEFPDWLEIDYAKMLRKTVKPKIEKLLESMDIKWEEIETLLRPEFQGKKKGRKTPDTTLDMFFGGNNSA